MAQQISDEEYAMQLQQQEYPVEQEETGAESSLNNLKEKVVKGASAITDGIKKTWTKLTTSSASKQDAQYSHLLKDDFDSLK
jgi:hypothetical protein